MEEVIKKRPRGIYLLPNLLTTAALFSGFYAIVAAMQMCFDLAAVAIFVAMIADGLDGRVARLTHTQTAFGVQYDSLSDMVSFGVAPAVLMYQWGLITLGKIGWLVAFLNTAGAALRLARFNTQVEVMDKRYFQGLATTPAAGLLASFVWVTQEIHWHNSVLLFFGLFLTGGIALLMVSNIRYFSFKEFDVKGKIPFLWVLMLVLIFVGVALDPPLVLFLVFFTYALSGLWITFWNIRRMRFLRLKVKHKMRRPKENHPESPPV